MAYNGAGTFSLYSPGNPVVTGTTISSTWANNTLTDIATGLSTAITKDGQTTTTQRIPFAAGISNGSQTITALAAGTATTHAATVGQLQSSAVVTLGTVAGTNTITAAGTPAVAAYATGQSFEFIPANTNTGATTINIDSIGAKNIYFNGAALIGGELRANVPVRIKYDGTQFHIIGNGAGVGWQLLGTAAASSSATLDFAALFSSTYDFYMMTFDITPATDDVYLGLRVGTGGTPTYQTSGYEWGGILLGLTGSANVGSTTDLITDRIAVSRPGAGNGVGNAAGDHICGEVYFSNPDSGDYPLFNISTRYVRSDNAGQGLTVFGRYGSATIITAVRLLFSSGNIASGSAQIYGLRK